MTPTNHNTPIVVEAENIGYFADSYNYDTEEIEINPANIIILN